MITCHMSLGGFLCPGLYNIGVFLQCLGSTILVRIFHQLSLVVNILIKLGVHHGLQTFFSIVKLSVNISLDTSLFTDMTAFCNGLFS